MDGWVDGLDIEEHNVEEPTEDFKNFEGFQDFKELRLYGMTLRNFETLTI